MDWNTGNNPWAPGGKMTAGLPWAQQGLQGMQHGWQQAGGFFAPKSQAQIQREALLQLAILAAVVAAPALLGAGGGAGAATAATTTSTGTTAAATTSMVEGATIIAPTAPIVTTGTAATVTGAAAASGPGAAALMPFIGAAALQNLLGAAMGGPQVLNQALQQQAPATRPSFVFDPGQAAPQLDKDGRHPAMPMLEEMAGKIGKDRMLELSLRRALATGNLTGLAGQPAVMGLVGQAVRAIPPGNPWAGDLAEASNRTVHIDLVNNSNLFGEYLVDKTKKHITIRLTYCAFTDHPAFWDENTQNSAPSGNIPDPDRLAEIIQVAFDKLANQINNTPPQLTFWKDGAGTVTDILSGQGERYTFSFETKLLSFKSQIEMLGSAEYQAEKKARRLVAVLFQGTKIKLPPPVSPNSEISTKVFELDQSKVRVPAGTSTDKVIDGLKAMLLNPNDIGQNFLFLNAIIHETAHCWGFKHSGYGINLYTMGMGTLLHDSEYPDRGLMADGSEYALSCYPYHAWEFVRLLESMSGQIK